MQWQDILSNEKKQPYFQNILAFLASEKAQGKTIYPSPELYFNAFKLTPLSKLKVVILGQDPYHGPNQAHGLSFSVPKGIKIPPSLQNIFKELIADQQLTETPTNGCLENWARQGVLLLNTSLSVEAGKPQSHSQIGWQAFTDIVIQEISKNCKNIVFLLWGSHAQKKQTMIDQTKHLVLTATHPSPLSAHRGFLGCKHFSLTNKYLSKLGTNTINWNL